MSTDEIVRLLIAERDRITLAIEALGGGGIESAKTSTRPGRTWSEAQRKAQGERIRRAWAAKKKAKKAK